MTRLLSLTAAILLSTALSRADVESGPKVGEKIGELKVFAVSGPVENKEVDYAAERKDAPTVYLFVQSEHFSRPAFRFMKTLDGKLIPAEQTLAIAVWLGDSTEKNKSYLERAKNSLAFEKTAVTLFDGPKSGPNGWGVNPDAHLTVVVASRGKVVKTLAFVTVNETDVASVEEAIKKAAR